ncbi:MAG: response regulator transcription factor [Oscillospiraceae bacterium]|nr:response regulator transcription factor [Ruminococcus sp.]MDY6062036.1 response regulator transcription factor [Oscillospiraceae bacterium]
MINTILVEDDLYIQKHLTERLNSDGKFCLVGVYRDAFEAERYCNGSVRLILMDVQTQHKHSGLAAAERIKKAFPSIKIVIVTSLVDPEVLAKAKTGAADSLWYKDHGTDELLDVINRTLGGENVFPNTSPAVEMEGTMSDTFSPRQLDILRWYIRGLTYQEIADKFGISKNGVRWNLDDMVEKGGFPNREALVATAIENKLMVTTLKDE